MSVDLTPVLQPLLDIAGIVVSGLALVYVPRAIAAFQARTGIQLTQQQQATVLHAVQTGAGAIETKLDQGLMQVAHVNVGNADVQAEAQAAINAVPVAAAALGVTTQGIARMIVGAVDTGSRTPVPAAPAAAAAPAAQ